MLKLCPSPKCKCAIVTCSEMRDVWINEIGPKLDAIDIVRLSMVNQWARHIAHNIKQHNRYATVTSTSKYHESVVAWPGLKWDLRLRNWRQAESNDITNSKWCDVVSLLLEECEVFDLSFVETRRLETFTFSVENLPGFDTRTSNSVASMLVSCTRLVSLSLERCIDKNADMEWLAHVLAHLTHLSHLSLYCNDLGAETIKRVCGALCQMSRITSLNLGWNLYHENDDEAIKCVCPCLRNMLQLETLILTYNNIRSNGTKHVCAALANKQHLTHLDLDGNHMTSEGVRCMLFRLTQLPKLSCLKLGWNNVNVETAIQVREMLPHVKELYVH